MTTRQLPVLAVVSSSIAAIATILVYTLWRHQIRHLWGSKNKKQTDSEGDEAAPGRPQLVCFNNATARQQILGSALERAATTCPPTLKEHLSKLRGSATRISLVNQVGGLGSNKAPILSIPNFVLKPVQLKNYRGFREVAFYESLQLAQCGQQTLDEALHINDKSGSVSPNNSTTTSIRLAEIRLLQKLSQFTANYHGVIALSSKSNSQHPLDYFIILQDVTVTVTNANVMDIKLGTQTFEPDATPEKKQREASKYKKQSEFGFRLVGMRKYEANAATAKYQTWDKMHGRSLTRRTAVVETFREFFVSTTADKTTSRRRLCRDVMIHIHEQVKSLQEWFDENILLSFYSSSILIVYDERGESKSANLRIVDFGHVRRGHGGDEGYKVGLSNLSSILMELLE